MSRDDIIKLAREAGFDLPCDEESHDYPLELERFAALVEAAEREACAQLCKDIKPENHGVSLRDLPGWILGTLSASDAISARGQS